MWLVSTNGKIGKDKFRREKLLIKELTKILIPLNLPKLTRTREEWIEITKRIGIRLPEDYEEFINTYGSGLIGNFLYVFNPFSKDPNLNLSIQMVEVLSMFRESKAKSPKDYPYPLYFETNGIFPWGTSIDGDYYFWQILDKVPICWPIVVIPRHSKVEKFDITMTEFLLKSLTGQLVSQAIPVDWLANKQITFTSLS